MTLIVMGGILLLLVVFWVSKYNKLVKLRNWVDESWAQIDVQLKRRYDLIPNLVNTVKGYAKHERETLERVIMARNSLANATSMSPAEVMQENEKLTGVLRQLFALSESYPELRSNENFLMLQEQLEGTENKIASARQIYNRTVMDYNTELQMFPSNLVASVHHFTAREMLAIQETERENVVVSFD